MQVFATNNVTYYNDTNPNTIGTTTTSLGSYVNCYNGQTTFTTTNTTIWKYVCLLFSSGTTSYITSCQIKVNSTSGYAPVIAGTDFTVTSSSCAFNQMLATV